MRLLILLFAIVTFLGLVFGCWYLIGWIQGQPGFLFNSPDHWSWLINDWVLTHRDLPPYYKETILIALVVTVVILLGLHIFTSRASTRISHGEIKQTDLHGSSRWGTERDVRKARLDDETGVVLGQVGRKILRHNGPQHILGMGPPRRGKGTTWIINTLQSWQGSTIVLDIKGELWGLTSGFSARIRGHRVYKFQPNNIKGASRFNPLEEVRMDTDYCISDVQNIAVMVMDPDGKGIDKFFDQGGYEWLTIVILHTLFKVRKEEHRSANLRDVSLILSSRGEKLETEQSLQDQMLDDMADYDHGDPHVNDEVRRVAEENKSLAPETRGGIIKTSMIKLALYADPIVAKNTAVSDFKLSDIMNGEKPAHLFMVMEPTDIERMRPVIRLLFNQFLQRLITGLEFDNGHASNKADHRLLMLLDELTSIGKIASLERAMPYMPGYGIKCFIIVQDKKQLDQTYGRDNQMIANCDVRAFFTPNQLETAKMISELLGKTTVQQHNTSTNRKTGDISGSKSTSIAHVARDLMTPTEVMQDLRIYDDRKQKPGEVLVFAPGCPPLKAKQNLFFKDKKAVERTTVPPYYDSFANDSEGDEFQGPQERPEQEHASPNYHLSGSEKYEAALASLRAEQDPIQTEGASH